MPVAHVHGTTESKTRQPLPCGVHGNADIWPDEGKPANCRGPGDDPGPRFLSTYRERSGAALLQHGPQLAAVILTVGLQVLVQFQQGGVVQLLRRQTVGQL